MHPDADVRKYTLVTLLIRSPDHLKTHDPEQVLELIKDKIVPKSKCQEVEFEFAVRSTAAKKGIQARNEKKQRKVE